MDKIDLFYDNSKIFKFNLIPPKSKEEINQLVERDNSILYAFLLVFFAMLAFVLLSIFQIVLVTPKIDEANRLLASKDVGITNFNSIKKINGELFIKSKALQPVLSRDIKISQLLNIGNKITQSVDSSRISRYSRETTGEFVLSFVVGSEDGAKNLMEVMSTLPEVSKPFLRSVIKDAGTKTYQVIISFTLINI